MVLEAVFTQLIQMSFLKNSIWLVLALPVTVSLHCKKSNKNVEPPGAVEIRDSVIA